MQRRFRILQIALRFVWNVCGWTAIPIAADVSLGLIANLHGMKGTSHGWKLFLPYRKMM